MKKSLAAFGAALLFSPGLAVAQPAPTKPIASKTPGAAGLGAVSGATAAKGGRKPEFQDVRRLSGNVADAYQLERSGLAAYQKKEFDAAREFFEASWKVGQLPTAAYNLACLDALSGRPDAAFKNLDVAVSAGFDDDTTLAAEADFASIRNDPRFARVVAGTKKNLADGDAAVVREGIFTPPAGPVTGVLVLLHDASSDPLTVAGPFAEEASRRGLFLAAPRGPAKAGRKRFGWGGPDRAAKAVAAAVDEARRRAKKPDAPVLLAGVGRGGSFGLAAPVKSPGAFAGVATFGGPLDATVDGGRVAAALRGRRVYMGIGKDVDPNLARAFQATRDGLKGAGVAVAYEQYPGAATGLPAKATAAAAAALDALTGVSAAPAAAAPR